MSRAQRNRRLFRRAKAEALRKAQIQTLRRYPHPALWAAFLLVGEAE